ncbi:hypothetical protein BC829DRAFT_443760 [Chytridium lagenaria]|nr:hypothetical protein BC829DRAFT_443760 [Chytridium lagenaria]
MAEAPPAARSLPDLTLITPVATDTRTGVESSKVSLTSSEHKLESSAPSSSSQDKGKSYATGVDGSKTSSPPLNRNPCNTEGMPSVSNPSNLSTDNHDLLEKGTRYSEHDFSQISISSFDIERDDLMASVDDVSGFESPPALKLKDGGKAPTYLSNFFDTFNSTALAANRKDAMFDSIPAEAENRFKSEANFFFSNVTDKVPPMIDSGSMARRKSFSVKTNGAHGLQETSNLPGSKSRLESKRSTSGAAAGGFMGSIFGLGGPRSIGSSRDSGGSLGIVPPMASMLARRKSVQVGVGGGDLPLLCRQMSVLKHIEGSHVEDELDPKMRSLGRQNKSGVHALEHPTIRRKSEQSPIYDLSEEKEATSALEPVPQSKDNVEPDVEEFVEENMFKKLRLAVWWWWHQNVLCDIYPLNSSVEERLALYFDRRKLPQLKVNVIQLVALSISAVISGEFAGWNSALREGGFGGLIISTWVSGFMYLSLVLCLSEMALSIPVLGGTFGFSRAVAGDWIALVVGNSESLEYIMFMSLLFVQASDIICSLAAIDPLIYSPLIWLAFCILCISIISMKGSGTWDVMTYLTALCLAQIVAFCITVAVKSFDPSQVTVGMPLPGKTIERGGNLLFTDGTIGVLNAIPRASSTEAINGVYSIPLSYMLGWGILYACGIVLSIFNVLTSPGAGAVATSVWPMVTVLQDVFGDRMQAPGLIMMFPAIITNAVAMLWAASKQTWSLSRAGFLPQFMSLTTVKGNIPMRAALFLTFARDTRTSDVLLDLTILSAMMTYVGVGIVYILFRIRHPYAPRPFRSPLGIWGGIALLLLSSMVIIEQMLVSRAFLITMMTYAFKMLGSIWFYVVLGRQHSLPTEDALIYIFWLNARKKERKKSVGEHSRKLFGKKEKCESTVKTLETRPMSLT